MNDGLVDAFRHSAWATQTLLACCRELSEEQLRATVTGVYGSVIDTLRHIVAAEASYLFRLTGEEPSWDRREASPPDLATLTQRAQELAQRWEQFLSTPFDAERLLPIAWPDRGDYEVPAGVVLAQALHHADDHRSQVCTVLTTIGVAPPQLGVWNYALATGRARPRS